MKIVSIECAALSRSGCKITKNFSDSPNFDLDFYRNILIYKVKAYFGTIKNVQQPIQGCWT